MYAPIHEIALWGSVSALYLFGVILIFSILRIPKGFEKKAAVGHHSVEKEFLKNAEISMGETVIKRVDTLDDMIGSLVRHKKESEERTIQQLRVLRADLVDLLQAHSIESFAFEEGAVLDVPTRSLIKIVDTDRRDPAKPMRILETLRPGFRYASDLNVASTIIRKPEVRVG